tara:strand:+ start:600 stop:1952 length:1353 start_codon:yes stop_codon:yes gene_type:complete
MKTNVRAAGVPATFTHEGLPTDRHTSPFKRLERSVMACLLWEDDFYESGESIAKRIQSLIPQCDPEQVASLAILARTQMRLRSVPLLLAAALTQLRWKGIADLLPEIIQRADELTEFLAVWTKLEKRAGQKQLNKLPKSVARGLDRALRKFNEGQLARNAAEGKAIKLRDLIRLVHPKPEDEAQASLWKRALEGTLVRPEMWQDRLSAGEDKLTVWTSLLREQRLGALDILKNLRNMHEVGVDAKLIYPELLRTCAKVDLPFRYIQAARAVPAWEGWIESAMLQAMANAPKLVGSTLLLIDVSGSMGSPLSGGHKSGSEPMARLDAACALAILVREVCEDVRVFTFSSGVVEVPGRRGMALRDGIKTSQHHGGTDLGRALTALARVQGARRLIVITDEESQTRIGDPICPRSYMIDVATTQRGIGTGPWVRITGFSEAVLSFIQAYEREA